MGFMEMDTDLNRVKKCQFPLVFCHPEALFSTLEGQDLLSYDMFRRGVVGIAVDECHKVHEWLVNFMF